MAWESLERWAAHEGRPSVWLHHSVLNRNRLATLERVFGRSLPRARISDWLEALVDTTGSTEEVVQNSAAAIQTAALMPEQLLDHHSQIGRIILTADGIWVTPDPNAVFLDGDESLSPSKLVHPQLRADPATLMVLERLGIKQASPESVFLESASDLLGIGPYETRSGSDEEWRRFWKLARDVDHTIVEAIIRSYKFEYRQQRLWQNWRDSLRVLTMEGEWSSLFETLVPGSIVPDDGSRDTKVAVDMNFHEHDAGLLARLGAQDRPRAGQGLSFAHSRRFRDSCRKIFQDSSERTVGSRPREDYLNFETPTASGPLDVLERLSEEGRVLYTDALLHIADTYHSWRMKHDTQRIYQAMTFKPPNWNTLKAHGRVRTESGIQRLMDGLGDPPKNPSVTRQLLSHPNAREIRRLFEIQAIDEASEEPVGADDPVPLLDIWPGLRSHLTSQHEDWLLVRCDGFRKGSQLLLKRLMIVCLSCCWSFQVSFEFVLVPLVV